MSEVYSMTGFGRSEETFDDMKVLVEIKSVNHKFLDISFRMPKNIQALEIPFRKILKENLGRGKIDVSVGLETFSSKKPMPKLDEDLLGDYLSAVRIISEKHGLDGHISAYEAMKLPGVIETGESELAEEELLEKIGPVFLDAVSRLKNERLAEGKSLEEDILGKLSELEETVDYIESMTPAIAERYEKRLYEKLKSVLASENIYIDEARILSEVAIFSDKIATDEETVRLHSHISAARARLSSGGAIGRELDFLIQEMMRESNTILAKAGDLSKINRGIALKTVIEKIREQVQNIE